MAHKTLFALILALLLGLGQQGALLHELSHLERLDPTSQQQPASPHTSSCDQCLSFSHFAHAIGASFIALPQLAASHWTAPRSATSWLQRHSPLYAARAPPHLV